jgi:hypothetical protein
VVEEDSVRLRLREAPLALCGALLAAGDGRRLHHLALDLDCPAAEAAQGPEKVRCARCLGW